MSASLEEVLASTRRADGLDGTVASQPASIISLVDAIERRHASQRAILAEVRDELSNLDAQIAAFLAESAEPRRDGRIFALRVGVALRTVAESIDGAAR